MNIQSKLTKIQSNLVAPKGQFNNFGNYAYRSCEDIMQAVKPLLAEYDCNIILFDEIVNIGERYYIRATARLNDNDSNIETVAYAREPLSQKGMNEAQITGSASSYARKYALNGLLAIDDTKDADSTNKHDKKDADSTNKHDKTEPKTDKVKSAYVNQNEKLNDALKKANIDIKEFHKTFNISDATLLKVVEVKDVLIANWTLIKANKIADITKFIKDTSVKLSQISYDELDKMCKEYVNFTK